MTLNNKIDDNILQPEEIVKRYYKSLYGGDIHDVRELMTPKSYYMALESLGLKLSFKNPIFKKELESIGDDNLALRSVEKQLSIELLSRNLSPIISIKQVKENGNTRKTVYYTEDGKAKELYFSQENTTWKINYYAGCKVC